MVSVLSEDAFQSVAAPVLRQIFVNDDPYDAPCSPTVECRLIVLQYACHPALPILQVLVETARLFGDDGSYVSILGRPALEQWTQPYDWFVPFMQLVQKRLPHLTADVRAFFEEWKGYHQDRHADISGIPALLSHVYGA